MLDTGDAFFNEELCKKDFCRSSKSSKVQENQMDVEIDSAVKRRPFSAFLSPSGVDSVEAHSGPGGGY